MGTGANLLQAEVIARLGNRSDINVRAWTWLNDAYFELLLSPRFTFFELETTVTAATGAAATETPLITLVPSGNVWAIVHITDTQNERRLVRAHLRDFDDMLRVGSSAAVGAPLYYAHFGATVYWYPKTDVSYPLKIRYRQRPPQLVDGQAVLLEREWDEVVTALAVCKGWEALEQWDKATAQRQLLEGALSQREEAMRLEDEDAEPTIGVRLEW